MGKDFPVFPKTIEWPMPQPSLSASEIDCLIPESIFRSSSSLSLFVIVLSKGFHPASYTAAEFIPFNSDGLDVSACRAQVFVI